MITAKDVGEWMNKKDYESDPYLPPVVDATNAYVDALPSIVRIPGENETAVWGPETTLGATMLAARLYGRRQSQGGTVAMGEGSLAYVARYDPDISRLLRIDAYKMPRIG